MYDVIKSVSPKGNGVEISIYGDSVSVKLLAFNYPNPRLNWLELSLDQLEVLYRSRVFTGQPFNPNSNFAICDKEKEVFAYEDNGLVLEKNGCRIDIKWIICFDIHKKLRNYFNKE